MSKLLILGAGGHGKVVADCALATGLYKEIAFLDDRKPIGQVILNSYPVIGRFSDTSNFESEYQEAFVAIGNNITRVKHMENLRRMGFEIPILIHPGANISQFAHIESGTVIMSGAVVNAESWIGSGGIINTCASVDHDCVLGKGVHLSPGVRLGGTVSVGDYTWVCIGASVVNNARIGEGCVIAAGSVVIKDVGNGFLVAGVPAREQKKLKENTKLPDLS